jgi:hypothetical protein
MKLKYDHSANAAHIDRVLASVRAHPEHWRFSYNLPMTVQEQLRGRLAARNACQLLNGLSYEVFMSTPMAAYRTILALIAYDDCAYMLNSDVSELRILSALGDDRASLLLPGCITFDLIKTTVDTTA